MPRRRPRLRPAVLVALAILLASVVAAARATPGPGTVGASTHGAATRDTGGYGTAIPSTAPHELDGQVIAHIAGGWIPNDWGFGHTAGGWQRLQWNDLTAEGVDAPGAWANLRRDRRPGGKGVVVAVLDTGVAYRNWRGFRESPDFAGTRFVDPCDLVSGRIVHGRCTDPYPLDRNGHGTWVAGAIAEATNNHIGVTGLAYGASVMPVRVLNAAGEGYPSTIATGIRYAVDHGAQVINLSLEFYLGVTADEIPSLISAIRYADARGVTVVAAAGNDSANQIAYPARATDVISVGATTADGCLADYSDSGAGLDVVAPGGGDDAALDEPDCHPDAALPDVYQMTFNNPARPNDFTLPSGWYGTSMAAPFVSATAALVIASRVLGRHPSPAAILGRLEATARPLGTGDPSPYYGYGLIDAAAATAPGAAAPPGTSTTTSTTSATTSTTSTGQTR